MKPNTAKFVHFRLFQRKQAVSLLYRALIGLVIGGFVMAMFIIDASRSGSSDQYLLNFYSKDLSLLVESMQAVPGDVQLLYPLEQGFRVELRSGELLVSFEDNIDVARSVFRLLPGHRVFEQEAQGLLVFTKQNNEISLDARAVIEQNTCPQAQFSEAIRVRVSSEPSVSRSTLSTEEIGLIESSIRTSLQREGFLDQSDYNVELIIVSGSDKLDEITLVRGAASNELEANYQAFSCHLLEQRPLQGMKILTLGESTQVMSIRLIIDSQESMKETFLSRRAEFAQAISQVFNKLKRQDT